jgi:hypothetical protein
MVLDLSFLLHPYSVRHTPPREIDTCLFVAAFPAESESEMVRTFLQFGLHHVMASLPDQSFWQLPAKTTILRSLKDKTDGL